MASLNVCTETLAFFSLHVRQIVLGSGHDSLRWDLFLLCLCQQKSYCLQLLLKMFILVLQDTPKIHKKHNKDFFSCSLVFCFFTGARAHWWALGPVLSAFWWVFLASSPKKLVEKIAMHWKRCERCKSRVKIMAIPSQFTQVLGPHCHHYILSFDLLLNPLT